MCLRGYGVIRTLLHCWWVYKLVNYGDQYVSFSENWDSSTSRSSSTSRGHIPKGSTLITQGHLLNSVQNGIICKSQKLETIKMSLIQRMDKENVGLWHNGILSGSKNNDILKFADSRCKFKKSKTP